MRGTRPNSARTRPPTVLTSSRSKLWPSTASSSERHAAFHPELVVLHHLDRRHLVDVVFILNLADDLFQNILERHDAGGAAELVDHDRQVTGAALKIAELAVERLRLGHERRGPDQRVPWQVGIGDDARISLA